MPRVLRFEPRWMLSGRAKIEQRPDPRVFTPQKGPDRRMRRHWPWPAKNFSKCDALHTLLLRRRIEFKIPRQGDGIQDPPSRGRRRHIGRGARVDATWLHSRGKHQYEPAFQSKATDAAVLPDRRREEPRASPVASAQSCSPGFGDIGPIPARPPANHRMRRDVLRNRWLHGARGRPRPGRFARRNRPISLPATDDRRSRWRVSSPKYVGRRRASLRQQV